MASTASDATGRVAGAGSAPRSFRSSMVFSRLAAKLFRRASPKIVEQERSESHPADSERPRIEREVRLECRPAGASDPRKKDGGLHDSKAVSYALPAFVRTRSPLYAIASLVLCCAFWGLSFPLMQMAADGLAGASGWIDRSIVQDLALRATYIGWRFAAAALLYAALTVRWQKGFSAGELRGGGGHPVFFPPGNLLQLAGLPYALPSVL